MNTVYLGLGSNLGDRNGNILQAIDEMKSQGIDIKKLSSILETDPVGGPPQEKFLNAVARGETDISPFDLLELVKRVEIKLGRKRTVLNGPRTIDIDILLYSNVKINSPILTIPHPRMLKRNFIMTPLKEIEPELA